MIAGYRSCLRRERFSLTRMGGKYRRNELDRMEHENPFDPDAAVLYSGYDDPMEDLIFRYCNAFFGMCVKIKKEMDIAWEEQEKRKQKRKEAKK